MTGTAVEISGVPNRTTGRDIQYTVRIRMNSVDPAVGWGMTVQINFLDAE